MKIAKSSRHSSSLSRKYRERKKRDQLEFTHRLERAKELNQNLKIKVKLLFECLNELKTELCRIEPNQYEAMKL